MSQLKMGKKSQPSGAACKVAIGKTRLRKYYKKKERNKNW